MIHELRIYTVWPGQVPAFLKLAEERAMVIRGNDYGTCEGYWFTEVGTLNQIAHMWSYEDLNARQEIRTRLGQNPEWIKDYASQVRPLIRRQQIRLMHPKVAMQTPSEDGHVYEYRYYQTKMGKAADWLDGFTKVMPVREKYSQNIGVWHTEAENPNEVSHMWAYESLDARAASRAKVGADKDWRGFLAKAGSFLVEMNSIVLTPTNYSPAK